MTITFSFPNRDRDLVVIEQGRLGYDQTREHSTSKVSTVHRTDLVDDDPVHVQKKSIMHTKRNDANKEKRMKQLKQWIGTWNLLLACTRTKVFIL